MLTNNFTFGIVGASLHCACNFLNESMSAEAIIPGQLVASSCTAIDLTMKIKNK